MARGHIGQALRSMSASPSTLTNCAGGTSITCAIFCSRVAAIAQGLRELGLRDGDRVAIAALNSEYYLEWMLAVPCAGGIFAPLNYRWAPDEAAAAVGLIQPTVIVVDEHCVSWSELLRNACSSIRTQVYIGSGKHSHSDFVHAETIVRSVENPELELRWAPGDIALICFTSGTTATPKGVSLSHSALIVQSLAKLAMVGYSRKDVYLHTAPLCHIGGISTALAMVMAGSCHVVLPKFSPLAVLEAIRLHSISTMIVVPTMLKDILEFSSQENSSFPSITTILNGAGSIPSNIIDRVQPMFPNSQLLSAYGMTETCSSLTFLRVHRSLNDMQHHGVCVGKPAPHVEIMIQKEHILTRGPHVMEGYWRQEQETRAVMNEDGWLDTGDVGRFDQDGNLWLLGRSKDVIKTGAENVYAAEVEAVLARHPSISMVAVFGLPDKRLCEAVAAVVTLKQGWTWRAGNEEVPPEHEVSASMLRSHCRKLGLSRYKIPRVIVQQQGPLAATSTGKIRKREVIAGIASRL